MKRRAGTTNIPARAHVAAISSGPAASDASQRMLTPDVHEGHVLGICDSSFNVVAFDCFTLFDEPTDAVEDGPDNGLELRALQTPVLVGHSDAAFEDPFAALFTRHCKYLGRTAAGRTDAFSPELDATLGGRTIVDEQSERV